MVLLMLIQTLIQIKIQNWMIQTMNCVVNVVIKRPTAVRGHVSIHAAYTVRRRALVNTQSVTTAAAAILHLCIVSSTDTLLVTAVPVTLHSATIQTWCVHAAKTTCVRGVEAVDSIRLSAKETMVYHNHFHLSVMMMMMMMGMLPDSTIIVVAGHDDEPRYKS